MKNILKGLGAVTGAWMLFEGSMLVYDSQKYLSFWKRPCCPESWNEALDEALQLKPRTRQYIGFGELLLGALMLYISVEK